MFDIKCPFTEMEFSYTSIDISFRENNRTYIDEFILEKLDFFLINFNFKVISISFVKNISVDL